MYLLLSSTYFWKIVLDQCEYAVYYGEQVLAISILVGRVLGALTKLGAMLV